VDYILILEYKYLQESPSCSLWGSYS